MKIFYSVLIISIVIIIGLVFYEHFFLLKQITKKVEELYISGVFAIGNVISVIADTYGGQPVFGCVFYSFKNGSRLVIQL